MILDRHPSHRCFPEKFDISWYTDALAVPGTIAPVMQNGRYTITIRDRSASAPCLPRRNFFHDPWKRWVVISGLASDTGAGTFDIRFPTVGEASGNLRKIPVSSPRKVYRSLNICDSRTHRWDTGKGSLFGQRLSRGSCDRGTWPGWNYWHNLSAIVNYISYFDLRLEIWRVS